MQVIFLLIFANGNSGLTDFQALFLVTIDIQQTVVPIPIPETFKALEEEKIRPLQNLVQEINT